MRRLAIIFISCLLLIPATAHTKAASGEELWNQLENTSGQALELVKQKKYADAKQMLSYFKKKFLNQKREKLELSMTQLRILTTSYDHAERAVNSVSEEGNERIRALTQFHLVVDALHSDNQPLWRSTKSSFFNAFNQMKQAAAKKNNRAFQYYLNQFMSQYEMIHPALNVDLNDSAMERLESEIRFLIKHRGHFFSDKQYINHLNRMEKDFHALFDGTLEDAIDLTLPWIILSIGGIITIALFYAGLQKYKGEKKKKNEKVKKRSKL